MREAGWNQVAADWEIFRALGTVYAARVATDAWSRPRPPCPTASSPGSAWCWSPASIGAAGSARGCCERCIDDARRAGPRARARRHAGRPRRSIARSASRMLGLSPAGARKARRRPRRVRAGDAHAFARSPMRTGPRLCAYDAAAFGADRSALLAAPARAAAGGRARRRARRPHRGLLLGRDGRSASQIGPLVAEDDATAHALLARALRRDRRPGLSRFCRRQDRHPRLARANADLSAQRPLTRMLYRRATGFDDPARTFAVVGPEFG